MILSALYVSLSMYRILPYSFVLECPRLLPEPFWENATVPASSVPPGPAQVLECPRLLPESFWENATVPASLGPPSFAKWR